MPFRYSRLRESGRVGTPLGVGFLLYQRDRLLASPRNGFTASRPGVVNALHTSLPGVSLVGLSLAV